MEPHRQVCLVVLAVLVFCPGCSGAEYTSCKENWCHASCKGAQCEARCLGHGCTATCEGLGCNAACDADGGNSCRADCTGDHCKASCSNVDGGSCDARCEGSESEATCDGVDSAFCNAVCVGEKCRSRCVGVYNRYCRARCEGSECAAACSGVDMELCKAECKGDKCKALCALVNGTMCGADCHGSGCQAACDNQESVMCNANCVGDECAADCEAYYFLSSGSCVGDGCSPGSPNCRSATYYVQDRINCTEPISDHTKDCKHLCQGLPGTYNCQCPYGFNLNEDLVCIDRNECEDTNVCGWRANTECINLFGSYECVCKPGYITNGRRCDVIKNCTSHSGDCSQGCAVLEEGDTCYCYDGFLLDANDGKTCLDIDECDTGQHDCTGLQQCVNSIGSFDCVCPSGYVRNGQSCLDIDECETGDHKCTEPLIDSIHPLFGPASGGTRLAVTGSGLRSWNSTGRPSVKVGDIPCILLTWSATYLVVSTPSMPSNGVIGQRFNLSFISPEWRYQVWREPFVYKADPLITDVHPREALATGGIRLTVTGQALNSVSEPVLAITVVIREGSAILSEQTYRTLCADVEYSQFICPSPTIYIPAELLDRIKKELTLTGRAALDAFVLRSKRGSTEKTLNFYLGFLLDGVEAYRDLRESPIKDKAEITIIHQPPTITKWDGVLEYVAGDTLQIRGEGFTEGCTVDDYSVTIGSGVCTRLEVSTISVRCYPPRSEPLKTMNTSNDDGHCVYLLVGDFQTYVGLLKYTGEDNWYESSPVVAGIGGGASVVLVTGLVLLCVCLCRKRKRRKQSRSQQKEADQSRKPGELGKRTALPGFVRRAHVTSFQNEAYLHPDSDSDTDGYLQTVQGQAYNEQPPGGDDVWQKRK